MVSDDILTNPNYHIGRFRSLVDFCWANHQALENHGGFGNKYRGTEDQEALRAGAIRAFHDGNAEKIQRSLCNPEAFAIKSGKVRKFRLDAAEDRYDILADLIKGSADPATDIKLALEKFEPEVSGSRLPPIRIGGETRESVLDKILDYAVWMRSPNVKLISAHLDAGADANAFSGLILAKAACPPSTDAVVAKLCAHNASFKDAAKAAESKADWSQIRKNRVIDALTKYRLKYPPKPAEEDPAAKVARLKRELAEAQEQITGTGVIFGKGYDEPVAAVPPADPMDQKIAVAMQAENARGPRTRTESSPFMHRTI